ncbi:MAG: c-type cytochrome [Sulfurimonas sp.]
MFIFTACGEKKSANNLDGKKLIEVKCASCHNLDMPPKISKDELAPPMMAVAFHVKNFVTPSDESQRVNAAENFVVDYVMEPSLEKSFCDKESLKRYGLMPSLKGKVTEDELKAIALYMFANFTQKNLTKKEKELAAYNALSAGEKLALKYRCLGCHKVEQKIVGPSFRDIAKRYANSKENLAQSIKNGSKGKWKSSRGAVMPAFKDISDAELKTLAEWIATL